MASRIKNFSIMGVHWKIEFLRGGRGGVTKNQCIEGNSLKRCGGLGQFAPLRGCLAKKLRVVFLKVGVDTPVCTV